MKTPGFRKTVLAAGMIVIGMGFTGCVEYTAPLCTADNLEDITGLEGHKVLNSLDQDYNLKAQAFDINHTGKGSYFNGAVQTCKVGSNTVMQSKTSFGTYSILAVNAAATGLSISTLVMGVKELDQAGIKYLIGEREQDNLKNWSARLNLNTLAPSLAGTKTKVMVIDNRSPESRAVIEKYAVPFGLGAMLK